MNLLTPNDFIHLPRRKSVCSGQILLNSSDSSSSNNNNNDISVVSTPSKKKERRRGSLSEPPVRRASLVQRWFKHITDAAEAYKARTRHNNPESTDDTRLEPPQPDTFAVSQPETHPPPLPIIPPIETNSVQNRRRSFVSNKSDPDNDLQCNNNTSSEDVDNELGEKNHHHHHLHHDDNDDEEEELGDKNSNSTRTLTQQCSLVAPSEVSIQINPALTAEPVITPAERLRRLDESIRSTLAEKQRIVCDMFRVPNEHFTAIADIAGQPEASKMKSFQEPSDIVLSAFAQVQSLTEILNDYIKVTTHQEISAVSTSLCDDCYRNQNSKTQSKLLLLQSSSQSTSASTLITDKLQQNIIEDEDGYCQIEELRTITIPPMSPILTQTPPQPQTPTSTTPPTINIESKRQSTVSADSIPEETEHEINALHPILQLEESSKEIEQHLNEDLNYGVDVDDTTTTTTINYDGVSGGAVAGGVDDMIIPNNNIPNDSHIEINDAYDSTSQMSEFNPDDESTLRSSQETQRFIGNPMELCATNRLAHVANLVPSVPCHLIAGYVSLLNEQITRLLPKLEERDIERDNLRKENQHLRELLNSMHEKKERVSESEETSTPVQNITNNSHE